MALFREIPDKRVVCAWTMPSVRESDTFAIGTRTGSSNPGESKGLLEFCRLKSSDSQSPARPTIFGRMNASAQFSSLSWASLSLQDVADRYKLGLLAAGMSDGSVLIVDPASVSQIEQSERPNTPPKASRADTGTGGIVTAIHSHPSSGPVDCVDFNPHSESSHLIASSSSVNGSIFIASLDRPDAPTVFEPSEQPLSTPSSESRPITGLGFNQPAAQVQPQSFVSWNTGVSHILASTVSSSIVIWDLRLRKPWAELRDPSSSSSNKSGASGLFGASAGTRTSPVVFSGLCWNPSEGLHVAGCLDVEGMPFVRIWDLRSPDTPVMSLDASPISKRGIVSISWNKFDPNWIATSSRGGKRIIWDLKNQSPIYQLPDSTISPTHSLQPSLSMSPALSASSLFGNSSSGSLFGPKPTSIPTSASVDVTSSSVRWSVTTPGVLLTTSPHSVQIFTCNSLPHAVPHGPPRWLNKVRPVSFGFGGKLVSIGAGNKIIIRHMSSLFVYPINEAFNELDRVIGGSMEEKRSFCLSIADRSDVVSSTWRVISSVCFSTNVRESLIEVLNLFNVSNAALSDDVPDGDGYNETVPMSGRDSRLLNAHAATGDFASAVEVCLRFERYSDALIYASCAGPEMWEQTRNIILESKLKKKNRLDLLYLQKILTHDLDSVVLHANQSSWREILSLIVTFAKNDEISRLCKLLANQLQVENLTLESSLCLACSFEFGDMFDYIHRTILADHANSRNSDELNDFLLFEIVSLFRLILSSQTSASNVPAWKTGTIKAIWHSTLSWYVNCRVSLGGAALMERFLVDELFVGVDLSDGDEEMRIIRETIDRVSGGKSGLWVKEKQLMKKQTEPQYQDDHTKSPVNQQQKPLFDVTPERERVVAAAAAEIVDNGLPEGWFETCDPASGKTYYYKRDTGETSWDRPQRQHQAPVVELIKPQPVQKLSLFQDQGLENHNQPKASNFMQPSQVEEVKESVQVRRIEPTTSGGLQFLVTLSALHERMMAKGENMSPGERRELIEIGKVLTQTRSDTQLLAVIGNLNSDHTNKLESFANALVSSQHSIASTTMTQLVGDSGLWQEHKNWLKVLRPMMQICKKHLV